MHNYENSIDNICKCGEWKPNTDLFCDECQAVYDETINNHQIKPATMNTRNQTLQALLDLEAEIKKLSQGSAVSATIKTNSMTELNDAAKQLDAHVFNPFEINDLNVHHFKYYIKGTEHSITVRHTVEYRMKKELVPLS